MLRRSPWERVLRTVGGRGVLEEKVLEAAARILRTGRLPGGGEDARNAVRLLGADSSKDRLEDALFTPLMRGSPHVFTNALDMMVGMWPTPLLRLTSLSNEDRVVWAKLEGFNPFSGSIKDRVAWFMFLHALGEGSVEAFYEATSTNTGMALAAIGSIHGIRTRLYLPSTASKDAEAFLRMLGAEVIRLPGRVTVEALGRVEEDARREGGLHLNQFENDANFAVHLRYTARELDYQLVRAGVRPDYVVAGMGTSGHYAALAFYFRNRYPGTRVVGVQPARNEVIPGIRRVETGMKWVRWVKPDEIVDVTRDEAVSMVARIARGDGVLVGISSGAVAAAVEKAGLRGVVAAVFPDNGFKYAGIFREWLGKAGWKTSY